MGPAIVRRACEGCHAWNGEGRQTPIAALRGLPSVNGLNVVQTIPRGDSVSMPQGQAFMPSFSAAYSDAEIRGAAQTVARARRD